MLDDASNAAGEGGRDPEVVDVATLLARSTLRPSPPNEVT